MITHDKYLSGKKILSFFSNNHNALQQVSSEVVTKLKQIENDVGYYEKNIGSIQFEQQMKKNFDKMHGRENMFKSGPMDNIPGSELEAGKTDIEKRSLTDDLPTGGMIGLPKRGSEELTGGSRLPSYYKNISADLSTGELKKAPVFSIPGYEVKAKMPETPEEEKDFLQWYMNLAKETELNLDPYDKKHHFDYFKLYKYLRSAAESGNQPTIDGHFLSKFKEPDHPNRYIVEGTHQNYKIIDTITEMEYPISSKIRDLTKEQRSVISYYMHERGIREAGISEDFALGEEYVKPTYMKQVARKWKRKWMEVSKGVSKGLELTTEDYGKINKMITQIMPKQFLPLVNPIGAVNEYMKSNVDLAEYALNKPEYKQLEGMERYDEFFWKNKNWMKPKYLIMQLVDQIPIMTGAIASNIATGGVGSFVFMSSLEAGFAYEELKQIQTELNQEGHKIADEQIKGLSLGIGVINGLLELASGSPMIARTLIGKTAGKQSIKKSIKELVKSGNYKDFLKSTGKLFINLQKVAGPEGITEALQEYTLETGKLTIKGESLHIALGKVLTTPESRNALIQAGGVGYFVGGVSDISTRVIKEGVPSSTPKKTILTADKIRDIISGRHKLSSKEQRALFNDLGLERKELRKLLRKKLDIKIEIEPEKIVRLQDKPYWSKVKDLFGLKYYEIETAKLSNNVSKEIKRIIGLDPSKYKKLQLTNTEIKNLKSSGKWAEINKFVKKVPYNFERKTPGKLKYEIGDMRGESPTSIKVPKQIESSYGKAVVTKLKQAKELIVQEKYDEAEVILNEFEQNRTVIVKNIGGTGKQVEKFYEDLQGSLRGERAYKGIQKEIPDKIFEIWLPKTVADLNEEWQDAYAEMEKAQEPLKDDLVKVREQYENSAPRSAERKELKEQIEDLKGQIEVISYDLDMQNMAMSEKVREEIKTRVQEKYEVIDEDDLNDFIDDFFLTIYERPGIEWSWNKTIEEVYDIITKDWVEDGKLKELVPGATEEVKEKKPAAAEKEAWKMTKDEHFKWYSKQWEKEYGRPLKGMEELTPERFHKAEVEQALSEGKDVPVEVLKEYPDLVEAQKRKSEEAPSTEELQERELKNLEMEKEVWNTPLNEYIERQKKSHKGIYKGKDGRYDAGLQLLDSEFHKKIVIRAIKYGKPVPENVLKDYPDLVEAQKRESVKAVEPGIKKDKDYKEIKPDKPEIEPGEQTTLKEQKKYIIDAIDEAIDEAPIAMLTSKLMDTLTGGLSEQELEAFWAKHREVQDRDNPEYVYIEVPGDGEFILLNDKQTLLDFKKRAGRMDRKESYGTKNLMNKLPPKKKITQKEIDKRTIEGLEDQIGAEKYKQSEIEKEILDEIKDNSNYYRLMNDSEMFYNNKAQLAKKISQRKSQISDGKKFGEKAMSNLKIWEDELEIIETKIKINREQFNELSKTIDQKRDKALKENEKYNAAVERINKLEGKISFVRKGYDQKGKEVTKNDLKMQEVEEDFEKVISKASKDSMIKAKDRIREIADRLAAKHNISKGNTELYDRVFNLVNERFGEVKITQIRKEKELRTEIFRTNIEESAETRNTLLKEIKEFEKKLINVSKTAPMREILEDEVKIRKEILAEMERRTEPEIREETQITKKGKDLAKKITSDTGGKKYGVRSIVEFLNDNIPVTMFERKEQVSQRYPAHYKPAGHFIRTSSANVQFNFHEHGHALYEILTENNKRLFRRYGELLKSIGKMPGSMASADNQLEGFAEWFRRFITNPGTVEGLAFTRYAEKAITEKFPDLYNIMLDARSAYNLHKSRSASAQFLSFSKDVPSMGILDSIREKAGWLGFLLARGYGIERFDRRIVRKILTAVQHRKDAINLANEWRDTIKKESDPLASYQNIVRIPAEVSDIFLGQKDKKNGVKVIGDDGNYVYLSDQSFKQIRDEVGNLRWNDFEIYTWAKTSLARWNVKQLQYPGLLDGITPETLSDIVKIIEADNKGFPEIFKEFEKYYNALLDVTVLSGERTQEDAQKMKDTYEDYAPLTRVIINGINGYSSGKAIPASGIMGAKGSFKAFENLVDAAEQRTANVISGYYWNKLLQDLYKASIKTQQMKELPFDVKKLAGEMITELKMDVKIKANLTEEEQKKIIIDYLNKQNPEANYRIDDINIVLGHKPVFRAVKPRAINLVAPFIDGKRVYLQINDPVMFAVFAGSKAPNEFMRWFSKVLTPIVTAWKRPLTGNIVFALRNAIPRDPLNAILIGEGKKSLIPGYYVYKGVKNRITGEHPEAKMMAELFIRTLEATGSTKHKLRNKRFLQELKEGIILDNWNKLDFWEKTAAVPGIAMHTILKPVNMALLMTGQIQFSELTEELGREGRAVQEIEAGGTDERMKMAHAIITGNFGEHSGFADVAYFLRTLGFVNPGIQIGYRQIMKVTDPIKFKRNVLRFLYAGVIIPAFFWIFKELISTDEDREREKERPEEDRFAYMDFKGMRVPFEYGAIGGFGSFTWNMLDCYAGGMKIHDRKLFAKAVGQRLIDLPGPSSMMNPILKSFIEAKVNYNFYFDKEIEPWWMGRYSLEERRYETTPLAYTKISELTKMSPLKIQHIVRSGFARQIDYTLSLGNRIRKGTLTKEYLKRNKADIPYVGRLFIQSPTGWGSFSVKRLSGEVEEREKSLRALHKEIIKKYGDKYKGTEEYKDFIIQYQASELLKTALNGRERDFGRREAGIKDYSKLIKEERKKEKPDWVMIEEWKARMVKIASDALLSIDKFEER